MGTYSFSSDPEMILLTKEVTRIEPIILNVLEGFAKSQLYQNWAIKSQEPGRIVRGGICQYYNIFAPKSAEDPKVQVGVVAEKKGCYLLVEVRFDGRSENDRMKLEKELCNVLTKETGLPINSPVSSSGLCFIATAAYGSPMAIEVETFRQFRDHYLLYRKPGQLFVDLYYRFSPPLAEVIAKSNTLRFLVRSVLLRPLLYLIRKIRLGE